MLDTLRTADGMHPCFSTGEFERRFGQVRKLMAAEDLDILLVYGTQCLHNEVQYLSNFPVSREAVLVFPMAAEPVLFVEYFNHVMDARRIAVTHDVRWGGEDLAETVARYLLAQGITRSHAGIVGAMPIGRFNVLRESLPAMMFRDINRKFQNLRLVKSAEELAFMRRGAELSDLAIRALERDIRVGMAEHELAAIVEGAYLGLGGQNSIHYMATTPMSDPDRCVPAQHLSNRVIGAGDVLITEISAQYHGYPGQIQRPFAIGTHPTAQYREMFTVAVEAFQRISQVIRAGSTSDVVLAAADFIHESGYTIHDDLLHGLGGGYLQPILRTRQTSPSSPAPFTFAEDMTIVIQPNVVTIDQSRGLQVGELVRVTASGVESLHHLPMRFIECG